MFQKKDFGNVEFKESLRPANVAAAANGEAVDTRGFTGVGILVQIGAASSVTTSNNIGVEIQHSDASASGWADVDADDLMGAASGATIVTVNAAAKANKIHKAAYVGGKRYVRAVAVEGGAGSSALVSAAFILTRKLYA